MARKKFAMLNVSLLNTPKFRRLRASDRNVYFTAHLSSQADYSGLFRYPLSLFASEAGIDELQLQEALSRLSVVDLLEYEQETELLRISGWFRSVNCPDNHSRVRSLVQGYLSGELPPADICRRSIAEFVVGSLVRTLRFKTGSKHAPKIVNELRVFLVTAGVEFCNLRPFLEAEYRATGPSIAREFDEAMLGLVEAEGVMQRASDRLMLQDASSVNASCGQDGLILAAEEKIIDSNKTRKEKEGHIERDGVARGVALDQSSWPLPTTVNSRLVRSVRGLDKGGR